MYNDVTVSFYVFRLYIRINETGISGKTGNVEILFLDSSSFRKIRARYGKKNARDPVDRETVFSNFTQSEINILCYT
jgi:hypothetical protein